MSEALEALRRQTLPVERWKLLIVDNASNDPVNQWLDLSWHSQARIVRENLLGIAHARTRGLIETVDDDLMLFIDDDNVISSDYIEIGLGLGQTNPDLGCWGGQLLPRYEVQPPDWIDPFRKYLAIFPLNEDMITSCFAGNYDCVPPTAGVFLRRTVADYYMEIVRRDPVRLSLGATGNDRIGCEDLDLALCAYDVGLSLGRFASLRLTHIIPGERLTQDYVAQLVGGVRTGTLLLEYFRHRTTPPSKSLFEIAWLRWQLWRLPSLHRSFLKAEKDGESRAGEIIRSFSSLGR